jgi:hypothetical protein
MIPERYEIAARSALGDAYMTLVRELNLSGQEASALLRLIAAHQHNVLLAAQTLVSLPGKLSRHTRANRRKLDSALEHLLGAERFAVFEQYRQTLSDQRCL